MFIDLSKAFDAVDHDILLSKSEYYGVCHESLPWFKNYFTGRKQFVHNDSPSSEELAITSGVPQGVSDPCYSLSTLMTYHVVSNTGL